MVKTFKFKLFRAKRNKKLHRQINACGMAYNHCIALHKRYWKLYHKSLNLYALQKHLTKLKKITRFAYLKEIGSQALQDITQRIDKGYQLFWDNLERKRKTAPPGCEKYSIICLEDLSMKFMQTGHGKKVMDYGFAAFQSILEYVGRQVGTQVVKVDQFFPSSQLCPVCGYQNPEVKDLRIREWTCPQCGTHHDRDRTAALNIHREGLRIFAET